MAVSRVLPCQCRNFTAAAFDTTPFGPERGSTQSFSVPELPSFKKRTTGNPLNCTIYSGLERS